MVRRPVPGFGSKISAPFRGVPRVLRLPQLFRSSSFHIHLLASTTPVVPLLFVFSALTIQTSEPRRAASAWPRADAEQHHHSSAAQCSLRILSLAHHLIPSISSSLMHCRWHSRTVLSLSHTPLPLRSGDLLSSPTSHSRRACALLFVLKCRYQSTPLCRLADPHE